MIGRTISHYEILEKLGEGGMSVVYKAQDVRLGRFVALKFLPLRLSVEEEGKQRFIHEARAVSALDHPNICTIYDIEEAENGQMFIAMAYYQGENLRQRIARGPLPLREALDIAIQTAQGLTKSHKQGVIHRDIKPANIIVTAEGVAKVLDFGVAKLINLRITPEGTRLGTPAYMSPEHILGAPEVDHRSDIWSLGVVLYEMLCGQLPFKAVHTQALLYSIVNEPPEPLAGRCPSLPKELEQIVTVKALAKDPAKRYQDAGDLLGDLKALNRKLRFESAARSTTGQTRPLAEIPVESQGGRRRSGWLLGAIVAVAIALALLIPTVGRDFFAERCLWAPAWFSACELPADKHVSMLTFENLGVDPAGKAFGDGLIESLTAKLTKLAPFHDSLCVHPARPDQQVFGPGLVLSGSVERTAGSVRVALKISNTLSSLALREWSSEIDMLDVQHVSTLQDQLIEQLASLLEVEVPGPAKVALAAGGTVIPGAFESYSEGLGYLSHNDLDSAASRFEQALVHDQYYALAQVALGDVYRRRYELNEERQWADQGVQICLRALDGNKQLDGAYLTLGRIYSRTAKHEQATAAFRQALDLNPLDLSTQRELAEVYRAIGQIQQAESVHRHSVELRGNCWQAHNRLGLFYDGFGNYEEAERHFRSVIDIAPRAIIGYTNLGLLYIRMDRYKEAANMLEASLQIQERPLAYTNLGYAYFRQGCYSDAARMMMKAVDLGLNEYLTWGNLAEAYLMDPQLAHRAPGAFRQAVTLAQEETVRNPTDAEAHSFLASYHARLGDFPSALAAIHQALKLAPRDINVLYRAAMVHELAGQRDRAIEALQAAVQGGYSLAEIRQLDALRGLRGDTRYRALDAVGYNLQAEPGAAAAEEALTCPSTPPGSK
jgi:tetratricopeptide (TPR) repeat protein